MADISAGLDLQEALKELPRRQRECVVLRYGLELSEKEVAEALLISVGAVKSNTHKGARLLRSLLTTSDVDVKDPAA